MYGENLEKYSSIILTMNRAIPRIVQDRTVLGNDLLLVYIADITLHDIEPQEFRDRLAEGVLFRGIRMQQLTQQQNLGRVEGLC